MNEFPASSRILSQFSRESVSASAEATEMTLDALGWAAWSLMRLARDLWIDLPQTSIRSAPKKSRRVCLPGKWNRRCAVAARSLGMIKWPVNDLQIGKRLLNATLIKRFYTTVETGAWPEYIFICVRTLSNWQRLTGCERQKENARVCLLIA